MPENEIGAPRKVEPPQSPPNWGQEAIERATKSYARTFVGIAHQTGLPKQNVLDHESKLRALGQFLLDNFGLIDSDGDKTLSRAELEKAGRNQAIDETGRTMLKLAEKNIEVLSGLCEEPTNYDKDPAVPEKEIKGQISRYDLYTLQKALAEPVAKDPYEIQIDRWVKCPLRIPFVAVCGGVSLLGGSKLADKLTERYVSQVGGVQKAARGISHAGGTRGQLLTYGCGVAGILVGFGVSELASRELFKFTHGSSSEYYTNRLERLTKFNW